MQSPVSDTSTRRRTGGLVRFPLVFALLYAGLAVWAEITVGRAGTDSAFQKLLAARGTSVDWVILGASHALPLAYGKVPDRLQEDTGQTAVVLADTGAGPLFNRFVFEQSLRDINAKNVLYIIDSFGFYAPNWNENRLADRSILRRMPLRASTAGLLSRYALREHVDFRALLDYLTGFSKLNDPARFDTQAWRGAENFDRKARPSNFATEQRIRYLYPSGGDAAEARYLDTFVDLIEMARSAGMQVTVIKMPLPDMFRKALPDEASFDAALRSRLDPLNVAFHDFSDSLPDAKYYFDSDHLNRDGVDQFYTGHLRPLLAAAASDPSN